MFLLIDPQMGIAENIFSTILGSLNTMEFRRLMEAHTLTTVLKEMSLLRKLPYGIDSEFWDLEIWMKIGILAHTGGINLSLSPFPSFVTKLCKKQQIILQLVMPNWLKPKPVYSQKSKSK